MRELGALFGSPLFQRIGWALLAFLWQGTLVAALLALANVALSRRKAAVRYAVGCGALLLMLAMPIATFLTQPAQSRDASGASAAKSAAGPASPLPSGGILPGAAGREQSSSWSLAVTLRRSAGPLTPFFVAGWILGVVLLSLRFLAGWTAARRLVRRGVSPVPPALRATLARLCERLAVSRPVRLMQSAALAVPTALGAVRPVILLPLCAAAGLSPEAVEALLAHELAHIRRHDYLVNLLQTAVETLLFYHPAVWWVSHRIRAERENCCDDLAVMATGGDPRAYARALVGLEEIRGPLPALAVAASGGSLWRRIARLLPVAPPPADRASGWLAGVLALAMLGTVGAAARISSFAAPWELMPATKSARGADFALKQPAGRAPMRIAGLSEPARPAATASEKSRTLRARVAGGVAAAIQGTIRSALAGGITAVTGGVPGGVTGGIPGGVEGGVTGADDPSGEAGAKAPLSPDDLTSLHTHGVTPEFLREISALGYKRASVNDLVALKIHGVSPEYISAMTALFGKKSLDELVSLRIHGVSPEFVQRFHAAGYARISADEALSLRIHGVDPDSAGEWEKLAGRRPGLDEIVSARIHGVTPEFGREMKSLGFEASLDTLVSFRIHGVTPELIRSFKSLGYTKLSGDEAVTCRIHGVTPEFVREIQSLGYGNLSIDELTALRIHGATPEFIRKANESARERLSVDELVDWRIHRRNR